MSIPPTQPTAERPPGYGMLRPAGERAGGTTPRPRPVTAWFVRQAFRAVGLLPLRTIQAFGAAVGGLLGRFPTRERRNTRRNARMIFPDWSDDERARFVRRSLAADGRMMAEHAALWTWERQRVMRLIRRVHGGEALREAMDAGEGVLLAALHLGSIEALCIYCSTHYQLRSQYREPRIRELDPFFRHARQRFGARLLPTSQGSVRLLLRGLRDGELIGIPCDQDAGEGAGVFVPFFGPLANTSTLITRLAQKSKARVFVAWAIRLPRGRGYELHFVPAPPAAYSTDLAEAAAALNRTAEAAIRACPEQWIWSYRRWRVQPPIPGGPRNENQIIARSAAPPHDPAAPSRGRA